MKQLADIAEGILDLGREVGSGLLELAWPTRCAICDMPGDLLCRECDSELPRIDHSDSCPRCGAPYGRIICTECWDRLGFIEHGFSHATCAVGYSRETARLVKCYKDQGELGLAHILASLIWEALESDAGAFRDGSPDAIVYVPATPGAFLRRGYDHMLIVAEALSEMSGLGVVHALCKADSEDQRSLGKRARKENMEGAFGIACNPEEVEGRRLLLVDDVLTTGATLGEASRMLYGAGAVDVSVATVCRVW